VVTFYAKNHEPVANLHSDIRIQRQHHAGPMNVVCQHCSALFFKTEVLHCCSHGAVVLPRWREPPEVLASLLKENDFRTKIRGYNCALSLGSSVFDDLTPRGGGPATFKMAGRSWRLLPQSVHPSLGNHKAAQIYSLPVAEATDRRSALTASPGRSALNPRWLQALHDMLIEHNALVRSFVQSHCDAIDWSVTIGSIDSQAAADNDTMVGLLVNGGVSDMKITVVPVCSGDHLIVVPDLDPYYQPLHFVLLFPYGDPQWGLHLSRVKNDGRKRKRASPPVTIHDYLRFHVQRRSGAATSIHDYGRLFEEWFVDCFLQSENHKLKYLRFNQSKFRSDSRIKLIQQLHNAVPPRQIGSPATHLPSSFVRGNRHFRELYADAMTLPAKFGSIDFFLTFTTNPSWPEIVENTNQTNGMNAPDLYCRVFHMKMIALLTDVLHNGVLGVVVAYATAVEFQNRGLPHLHALFIVRPEDKPTTPAIIDTKISAQFPDAETDLEYFQFVTKHMIHGPCGHLNPGHYCMNAGECRFDYPKRLQDVTTIPADGYTQLARPFGRSVKISDSFVADNSWVVPHNKFLLCKYNAHINVECSASVTVVKYMFSYVYKGTKTATAHVKNENDEIRQFSDGRVTSAAEAMWAVLRFDSHSQSPSVQRLGCNLLDNPAVVFRADDAPDDILAAADDALSAPSHLKAWFNLNRVDVFARTLTYIEIPEFYTWNQANQSWCRRKNGTKCLGRIHPVDFCDRERWAMRTLLLHARGCTCADDIRTVCDEVKDTFWEAAVAAGLFEDDREYCACLSSLLLNAQQLRTILVIILIHCQPKDPMALIHKFFDELTADFFGNDELKMSKLLQSIGNTIDVDIVELGLDPVRGTSAIGNVANRQYLETFVSHPFSTVNTSAMNTGQELAHDIIIDDVQLRRGTIFTLMAPAGTGKTHLIGAILTTSQRLGLRVVTCASSALAASLLGYSRTAHALFKIPINLDENSTCKPNSTYKAWLRSISMFIWDEISMAHRWAIDAVDRLLRDIHEIDKPFGGVSVLLSGDLRQLLPIHRFAKDPASFCLLTCQWLNVSKALQLTVNMRSANDPVWSDFITSLGNGSDALFPAQCVCATVEDLIASVWPEGNFQVQDARSILTLTRDDAKIINTRILNCFPGLADYALSLDAAMVSSPIRFCSFE
jgi:hypothetical protein